MSMRGSQAAPMKLTIIASQYPFSGRVPLVPPILEYLAALTLREQTDADITLVDANQQNISPDEIKSGVVAISAMTATITWAYRFADACGSVAFMSFWAGSTLPPFLKRPPGTRTHWSSGRQNRSGARSFPTSAPGGQKNIIMENGCPS